MLSNRPDFLSRFGHDLRAPLSSLSGVLQLLAGEGAPGEPLRGALTRQALAAVLQLQCQIDDAVSLSRLESAGLAQPPTPVDLGEVLRQMQSSLAPVCQALEVRLTLVDGTDRVPAQRQALAVPDLLRRVFESLAHQALRYAVRGHECRIGLEVEGAYLRLRWQGFAPGRAPHSLGPVFEPLETSPSGASPAGLGLRLARDSILAMGGQLALATSDDGRDTDLLLTLPAMAPANEPAVSPVGSGLVPGDAPARLLLIEDDPVSRSLVEHYLRSRPGIELQTASNGAEGLAKIRGWRPRLVVTDLRLPDMSGQSLMHRVNDECADWRQGARCVAFSADLPPLEPSPEASVQGKLFDETWSKPMNSRQFLAAVDRLLSSAPGQPQPLALQSV